MNDPSEIRQEGGFSNAVSLRVAAFRGAALASLLLSAVALWRGYGDGWFVAGALVAIALSAGIGGLRRRRSGHTLQARPKASARSAIAEAVLAHIPDPVILVDRRAVVIEANKAAHLLLPGLKIGHPLSFFLRSPDVLDGIQEVIEAGGPLRVEYSERVPTERTFEVHIGHLQAEAPNAAVQPGVVLFFRDLTSARRLEAMRADFVANASHELRTPLASLLGFIETLQGPAKGDPKARERFLEIMRVQAQRMRRLIDDLLSLSRIEMREHVSPTQIVDLGSLVTPMVEASSPAAKDKGVAIRVALPSQPVHVLGDRDELLRVIENLIENAVKYGESGGAVDISIESAGAGHGLQGRCAVLSVQDYGPGIGPEHLPRLTERFYRVDGAQSRDKGGTGLGLAIVKHIVNRHRGRLDISSEPGKGARFTVTLPEAPPGG
ncbi:ATP-binding protein [Microvirga makkahensis]|uniref:histidine kinase n=1 Tax=Microvirga makkahensis TaxID=1128670 RepID=A0A7X3MVN3_9HYPH|nr:ATP-binding protein [Microvirga makkahensis]MXQ14004.1 PAS domain-containing protein [Microvirga makkahensis]